MIGTIDWNLMAFSANLCLLDSKVGKILLMKSMQHGSAQSCQLWKFTNMWINILGFLILTYTSAYITFLINKTFHIKQFCITTRGVCSCDVHYLVSEFFYHIYFSRVHFPYLFSPKGLCLCLPSAYQAWLPWFLLFIRYTLTQSLIGLNKSE